MKRKLEEKKKRENLHKERSKIRRGKQLKGDSKKYTHKGEDKQIKQIAKSLGVSVEELKYLVSPNSDLNQSEKLEILSAGFFGTKQIASRDSTKYRSLTVSDLHILDFLDKFKFANVKSLANATNKGVVTTRGVLNKLCRLGMTKRIPIFNADDIYGMTEIGLEMIGSKRRLPNGNQSEPYSLVERMYVNHVASCLYSNKINALNLDDFPYKGRLFDGVKVRGEELVPESDMQSTMWKKIDELNGGCFVKAKYTGERFLRLAEFVETEWRKWENNGKKVLSPEMIKGNEFMFLLFGDNNITNRYIMPDIVVKRDRNIDGTPNSIAIEVEKTIKSVDEYIKKLLVYKSDTRVFSKVVYITPNSKIARYISEAAARIGFDRYDIVPPMNEKGPTREISGWII